MAPPVVTGVSPKEGPPGTRVTIRGEFLGASNTDLVGLKICGCDCLLSAEWKSKNKIVARSGPCKGRGDIIVTTRSGGEGTSTVQFRGYHESIGPVKESAVWVEEAAPPTLSWGRRPMSPASYAPPDPLGLSTEGDECKFPEEDLHELFPEGSGKLSDENFNPGWYLLEHHNMTTFEDLRAGALFLERKVDGQKEGQLSFLKANTGAVMDQLDRLILVKNMFEEDHRQNGKEPLISLHNAIEDSIRTADALFSDILTRKDKADKTRTALALLIRHKFLFQLPATIDRNIKKKEYDLVVNDYARVKNLFGWTEVKLFQKILAEIDKRIFDLREKLHIRIQTMPIHIQEQRKLIQILLSLLWEEDAGWVAINARKDYLMNLMNKLKDYFKLKEQQELEKSKRKSALPMDGGTGEWSSVRELWCGAACGAMVEEVSALWTLARWYFAGELGGTPTASGRSDEFKQMIISSVEVLSSHMRAALLMGSGACPTDALRSVLAANLKRLRDAHDTMHKLDLPSQPLAIVEKVIMEYRVHGMVTLLQKGVKRAKSLESKETWKIEEYSEYGAVTKLPRLMEAYITDTLSSIHKCVAESGRKESVLLEEGSSANATLQKYVQDMLLAYVNCLQALALENGDQDFSNNSLSVALGNQKLDGARGAGCGAGGAEGGSGRELTWQQRLLITGANALYTRHVTLNNIAATFDKFNFPKPTAALQATKEALSRLEASIAETYLENKGDPLVGTIEPSMYMGRYKWDSACVAKDSRPYVYEIINNLIAVHAEIDSVCGDSSSRYVRDICETVCEELARLAACIPTPHTRAARFQARLEMRMLHTTISSLLSRKAENYLMEALAGIPPLDNDEDIRMVEKIVGDFRKRMELQIMSLNSNMETV